MSCEQGIQCSRCGVEVATFQVREHAADSPSERGERRDMRLAQLRNGRRIDSENAGEGGHSLACRQRHAGLAVRSQLVDELCRHQQARVFVTV